MQRSRVGIAQSTVCLQSRPQIWRGASFAFARIVVTGAIKCAHAAIGPPATIAACCRLPVGYNCCRCPLLNRTSDVGPLQDTRLDSSGRVHSAAGGGRTAFRRWVMPSNVPVRQVHNVRGCLLRDAGG